MKQKIKCLQPFIFYLITIFIFPFSIDADVTKIKLLAPSILSISLLFTSILSTSQIFDEDFKDGFHEQVILFGISPKDIVIAKISTHFLTISLPVIVALPILLHIFLIDYQHLLILIAEISLITLMLSSIGVFSASLTINLHNGGMLATIIALPLTIACIILASESLTKILLNQTSYEITSFFLLILGFAILTTTISTIFAAMVLSDN